MEISKLKTYAPNFSIGMSKERYFEGKEGFIFLIPEVWGNSTFLNNELRLITELKSRFGIEHYFCEGAFYEFSSEQIKAMLPKPADEINKMFRAGQLKAQEYLALCANDHMMLYGADNEEKYNNQNAAYYAARDIFPYINSFFSIIRNLISELVFKKNRPEIVKMYDDIMKFNKHETFDQDITEFAKKLLKFAKNQGIKIFVDEKIERLLVDRSNLSKPVFDQSMAILQNETNNILSNDDPHDDFLKKIISWQAGNEKMSENQVYGLSYNGIFSLYKRGCDNLKLLINNAIESLSEDSFNVEAIEMVISVSAVIGVDKNKYSELFNYFHQNILYNKSIKGSYHILGGYVEESIVEQFLNNLNDNGFLKRIYKFETELHSIENLFRTELIPEKAREIPYLINKYKFNSILEMLIDLGIPEFRLRGLSYFGLFWEQSVARTKRFYDNAFSRSQYMLDYCTNKLKEAGTPVGVLMVGGFHTQPIIRALLRDGRYSFHTIQCQIGKITPAGRSDYDALMDRMNK